MNHARFLQLVTLACVVLLPFAESGHSQILTRDQYIAANTAALDAIITRTATQPQYPLLFNANLFFAHEVAILSMPLNVLTKTVDAFREAGVLRVEINLGLWPWRADRSLPVVAATIAKYDAIIQYIRQSGLQVVLNPQYSNVFFQFTQFEDWKAAAAPVYVEIAQRYQPNIFVVAHEPTTMTARMMGVSASPSDWRVFVQDVARQIRAVAPRTRLGAGGLFTEMEYFENFLTIEEIDTMTIDIYGIGILEAQLRIYDQMISLAQEHGKAIYIEETWRPPYFVPQGRGETLDVIIASGIGDSAFEALDAKWLQGMSQYASTRGLEAITPFWMQTFFLYVQRDANALDPAYNQQVAEAIVRGDRTQTYQAFRDQIQRLGAKHVSVNSASFIGGLAAPESLVSMFALPGTLLADFTESATEIPLPTSLGGATVLVTDRTGIPRVAPLLFASPTQINFQIPPEVGSGPTSVTVQRAAGDWNGAVQVAKTRPGLFSANASGQGVAAAQIVRVHPDNTQSIELIHQEDPQNPGRRVSLPIDLGPESDQVVLILFGTGIRRNSDISSVTATVGGVDAPVLYAGDQLQFVGLDQVNLILPRALIGRGELDINLLVDGKFANTVTVNIR